MPTATLLIEIVIIGCFANLNLLLLGNLFVPLVAWLTQAWQMLGAKEGVATLAMFLVALGSYVIGVIVNVCTSNLFDPLDDYIREREFSPQVQAELGELDAWIKAGDRGASAIYHYLRYRLYAHGQTVKEQLDQHRSEIRILRATAFNSYWLMVILLFPSLSQVGGTLYLSMVGLLCTMMLLLIAWSLPLRQPSFLVTWKEGSKEKVCHFYQWAFGIALILPWPAAIWAGVRGGALIGGGIAGGLAVGTLLLWGKQQRRFYQALFQGFRALAVDQ